MSSGSHVRGDPWMIQVLTPVAVLVTAVVGVRISLRFSRRTGLWLDDWLILISLVFVWGLYAISVLTVTIGGIGTPFRTNVATDPSMVWLGHTLKLLYASQMVYATSIMTAKLSILALYWRLFPTLFMKRGCIVLAVMTAMWWIAGVLVDIFQCTPVSRALGPSIPTEGCISQDAYCFGMIIPNILIDMAILCLPTFEVSKLHLPRSQKCALASVFLLGAAVMSASGIRLHYHLLLVTGGEDKFDFTLGLFKPQLWMTLEPDMAIICACLPVMRPLVTMLLTSPFYRSITSYLTPSKLSTSAGGSLGAKHSAQAALNTIGGSSVPSSTARGKIGASHASNPSKYALSSFDSLEYLADEDVEAGRLVRDGRGWSWHHDHSIGCQTQVSRSQSIGGDEVPLGAIAVTTVVDCREMAGGPSASSHVL
ncbi:hypothetical protein N8I77_002450 [Diaporthe amygdali]|uniref:Rhodopsin domain-containing protein n=1 Tax=Phomopsis amygdali TaxID=1214568 RepID=A0AAD9SSR3_PHOAM|nr:hypothetical protein N8I77_002450 [Diaporthe amygdali]